MAVKGTILQVQRFCTHDGPGIRTTVFLKGCPLSCLWCHNPESQARGRELLYDADKCLHCLRCVTVCPQGCHTAAGGHTFSRERCVSCFACLSPLCPALEAAGRETDDGEILAEVLRDKLYYDRSGGGLTLSGGEPFYQSAFALSLLRGAKEAGISTCVETCGAAETRVLAESAAWTDLYLFDCKETDPARHRAFTGADNAHILKNLRSLDALGKATVLRCPVIPGYNDRPDHFAAVAALAEELHHILRVEVEPYHTLGAEKYRRLGRDYAVSCPQPVRETAETWVGEIQKGTHVPVILAL